MQKYKFATETHKMTIVLAMGFCNFLLHNARIGDEKTSDMRDKFRATLLQNQREKFYHCKFKCRYNETS